MNKFGMTLAAAITGCSVMFGGPALADDADVRTVVHVKRVATDLELIEQYDAVTDIEGSRTGSYACPESGAVIATFADVDREGPLKGKVKVIGAKGKVLSKVRAVIPRGGTFVVPVDCNDFDFNSTFLVRFDGRFEDDDDKEKDDDDDKEKDDD